MIRLPLLALLTFSCTSDSNGLADATGGTDAIAQDAEPRDADPIDAVSMDAAAIDAEAIDAEPMDAEPIDAEPADADDSDGGRTCASIEAEYQEIVSRRGCVDEMQCQVVDGHCSVGLGGCWYTVNLTVMQTELDALAQEYVARGCTSGVCDCQAPPGMAICDNNQCAPLP
jgi:hypothetical protein